MKEQWYSKHIDQIKQLLQDGLSASQIGVQYGVSRNAVIGIVSRHEELRAVGFTRSARGGEDSAHKVARIRREKAPRPEKPKKQPQPVTINPDAEVVRPDIAATIYDANSLRVELHNIPAGGCHFAVNDVPRGGVYLFCGCPVKADKAYCDHHYRRVYRAEGMRAA